MTRDAAETSAEGVRCIRSAAVLSRAIKTEISCDTREREGESAIFCILILIKIFR